MKPSILYLLMLFFVSESPLAQSITYKDLAGSWDPTDLPGKSLTDYNFIDSNTLFITTHYNGKQVMKYSLDTLSNKQILKFTRRHQDSLGIQMFWIKKINQDKIFIDLNGVTIYDRQLKKWRFIKSHSSLAIHLQRRKS